MSSGGYKSVFETPSVNILPYPKEESEPHSVLAHTIPDSNEEKQLRSPPKRQVVAQRKQPVVKRSTKRLRKPTKREKAPKKRTRKTLGKRGKVVKCRRTVNKKRHS